MLKQATNTLSKAITMLSMLKDPTKAEMCESLGITLQTAVAAYMSAFHEDADTFYLYTPACISVIIDLYNRPTAQA